ncbi:MAG: class I SAM-dependent methyltransferase [bacterium]|nr:class I SAM-dependent methyltransferase [bacterium]
MSEHKCRFCGTGLERTFADLGESPLANSFVKPSDRDQPEAVFPLRVLICSDCLLVQLPEFETPENIFSDYAYFSSFSDTWLDHARRYVEEMTARFGLSEDSQIVEVASNDGYLLRFFKERGIPVLGVEPAANVAQAAIADGIPTEIRFFGETAARELAKEGYEADLLLGNNVLAHVPDLNDFVHGLEALLKPDGVITMEFPHVMRLMEHNQFDTIYHEHFSYLSLATVRRVFAAHGLRIFDVQELSTHGGSLRIFAAHETGQKHPDEPSVQALLETEAARGMNRIETYLGFDQQAVSTRKRLLEFLDSLKAKDASIAAYGAPAKGNTLLNYCGIGSEVIDYTVDRNPHKQGKLLPGSRIPVYSPEKLRETRPDYVFILPWNLRDEISSEWAEIADWGGRFFVAIPEVEVL